MRVATALLQDGWDREISIVTAQMDLPPYNDPPEKLAKAAVLVRTHRVTKVALATYRVLGDAGVTYTVAHNTCECPASVYGKTKACKHVVATQIYQRCLAGGVMPPTRGDSMDAETLAVVEAETVPSDEPPVVQPEELPAAPRTVFLAMAEVAAGLARAGVAKSRMNPQTKQPFRGIDDIQNAAAPLLVDAGLLIIPLVESVEITERASSSGTVLRFALAKVTYTFLEVTTGQSYATTLFGEAFDTGDKAVQKAMTFAYKELLIQTFCIPVQGQEGSDEEEKPTLVRPVPSMVPQEEYRNLITRRMRAHGKSEAEITHYWQTMTSRYGESLETRLPRIWELLQKGKGQVDEASVG